MGAGEWWICRRLIEYISPTHTMRPFLVKGEGCSPLVAYGAYLMDLGQLEIRIKKYAPGVVRAILKSSDVGPRIGTPVAQPLQSEIAAKHAEGIFQKQYQHSARGGARTRMP